MNRRQFFKFLGATVAATTLPVDAVANLAIGKPIPLTSADLAAFFLGKEFGRAIHFPGNYKEYEGWAGEFLIEDAKKFIPVGSVVSLQGMIPMDYGLLRGMAWYTNQRIALSEPTGLHPATFNRMGGYFDYGSVRL